MCVCSMVVGGAAGEYDAFAPLGIIAALFYAGLANAAYCAGFAVELLSLYHFKSANGFSDTFRWLLWVGGTGLSALIAGIPLLGALL